MLIRILKAIISPFAIIFLIYLGKINLALYYSPNYQKEGNSIYNKDLYKQLQHIRKKLNEGAAEDMQGIYPEGYMFMNALYGITWAEFASELDNNSSKRKEALQEIDWAIEQVFSEKGKAPFAKHQALEYGAFYAGWSNYLLGKRLQIASDSTLFKQFKINSEAIAKVATDTNTPFPSSYISAAWPADITVGIASLSLFDQIATPKHKNAIDIWYNKVQKHLDKHGLIPHETHHKTGQILESARGCSQTLMLYFLYEINPDCINDYKAIYKEKFLTYRFGLPGILEYPKGTKGSGDIDSGPVILDVGGAASIVGQATMIKLGEYEVAKGIRNSIEGFGWSLQNAHSKKYLFGQLAMADVFIAWANATDIPEEKQGIYQEQKNWRFTFQLISSGILMLVMGLLHRFWLK